MALALVLRRRLQPLSRTFFALSTIFLSSAPAFSTTFSIMLPAFLRSSGLADLFNCNARSFFCCFPRASLTAVLAFSPDFVASVTAAFRESAVGGGMFRTSNSGFAPVGSGCGVSDSEDA